MESYVGSNLDLMLSKFCKEIAKARMWLESEAQIAYNAKLLKKKGFSRAFGISQMASQRAYILNVCNLFDNHPEYPSVNISQVLRELRTGDYEIQQFEEFNLALSKLGVKIKKRINSNMGLYIIEMISKQCPNQKVNQVLQSFFTARNKLIAHIDQEFGQRLSLGTLDEIETLLQWADDFADAIYVGYLPAISPVDTKEWAGEQVENLISLIVSIIGESNYINYPSTPLEQGI